MLTSIAHKAKSFGFVMPKGQNNVERAVRCNIVVVGNRGKSPRSCRSRLGQKNARGKQGAEAMVPSGSPQKLMRNLTGWMVLFLLVVVAVGVHQFPSCQTGEHLAELKAHGGKAVGISAVCGISYHLFTHPTSHLFRQNERLTQCHTPEKKKKKKSAGLRVGKRGDEKAVSCGARSEEPSAPLRLPTT